jgi:hypothetical protein
VRELAVLCRWEWRGDVQTSEADECGASCDPDSVWGWGLVNGNVDGRWRAYTGRRWSILCGGLG